MKPTPNIYDASQTRDLSKLAPAKGGAVSADMKQRARETIEQLAALDRAKKIGGGIHGQVVGMEPWVIRTNGDGLQCLFDAQCLIDELVDPFDRRATPSPAPIQQDAWISVEDQLPAVGQVVAVYSPPTIHDWPGSINLQFDCIDENDDDASSWAGHNDHYEHWCCVAKSEGDTGPSEKAPYTHWLPIPAAPTVNASQ